MFGWCSNREINSTNTSLWQTLKETLGQCLLVVLWQVQVSCVKPCGLECGSELPLRALTIISAWLTLKHCKCKTCSYEDE